MAPHRAHSGGEDSVRAAAGEGGGALANACIAATGLSPFGQPWVGVGMGQAADFTIKGLHWLRDERARCTAEDIGASQLHLCCLLHVTTRTWQGGCC